LIEMSRLRRQYARAREQARTSCVDRRRARRPAHAATLATALLGALAWAIRAASADGASTIIERRTRGEPLSDFSTAAYTTALAKLPASVEQYIDCEQLIRAAAPATPAPPPPPAPVLGEAEVAEGKVAVHDLLLRPTRTVTAGHSYTAGQATHRRR
jgi:hypothetical protein